MRKPDSINPVLMHYLGRRIRARREAIEASPSAFAEPRGFDRNLWGRIERGQQNMSISTLGKVAAALGVTMGELVLGLEDAIRLDADGVAAVHAKPPAD